jgi:hypothetical protein
MITAILLPFSPWQNQSSLYYCIYLRFILIFLFHLFQIFTSLVLVYVLHTISTYLHGPHIPPVPLFMILSVEIFLERRKYNEIFNYADYSRFLFSSEPYFPFYSSSYLLFHTQASSNFLTDVKYFNLYTITLKKVNTKY